MVFLTLASWPLLSTGRSPKPETSFHQWLGCETSFHSALAAVPDVAPGPVFTAHFGLAVVSAAAKGPPTMA